MMYELVTIESKQALAQAIDAALAQWERKHPADKATTCVVEDKLVEAAQAATYLTVIGHHWMAGKVGVGI